jgi:uncharacterized cupin superfamily protein
MLGTSFRHGARRRRDRRGGGPPRGGGDKGRRRGLSAAIRLTADGLEDWGQLDAKDRVAGEGRQRGRSFWEGDGLSVGTWACTPFEGGMSPWSVDEFMVLLEGRVILAERSGRETTVEAGTCFAIPKGLDVAWIQPEPVLKYYAILDRPGGETNPTGRGITVIDPAAALSPLPPVSPDLLVGPAAAPSGRDLDADPAKGWALGLWRAEAGYHRRRIPFPRAELMHGVAGEAWLEGADGRAERLGPGDTLFVAPGMEGDFAAAGGVTKVYCSVTR